MKKSVFLIILSFCFLSACSSEQPDLTATPSHTIAISTSEPTPSPSPSPTPYNGPLNPLTGLPIDASHANSRPYAIMINNLKEALPQCGIQSADIIYEVLAEGGITRMLAIYQDISNAGVIGTIRSARPYYIDISQGHDAIYIHAGGSEQAYSDLWNENVDHVDGVRGNGEIFYRDDDRIQNAGYEHSLFTTSTLIEQYVTSYFSRYEHEDDYSEPLIFTEDGTPKNGEKADSIQICFSDYKTGRFLYDKESGKYLIEEYEDAYIDGNTGEQVSTTNVLILFADTYTVDNEGRLAVDLIGSGEGYFACGGKYISIEWKKEADNLPFSYYTTDGKPLELGCGCSYINILPYGSEIVIE